MVSEIDNPYTKHIQMNPDAESFDPLRVAIFKHGEMPTTGDFAAIVTINFEEIEKKQLALRKAMAEHPLWQGSYGCITAWVWPEGSEKCMVKVSAVFEDAILNFEPGSKPWMGIMVNNARRFGPFQTPVNGRAGLTWSNEDTIVVVTYPCDKLLASGITLDGYDRFLCAKEGEVAFANFGSVAILKKAELCYIPCGVLYNVLAYQKAEGRNFKPGHSTYMHLPLAGQCQQGVDPSVMTAVKTWNDACFVTKPAPLWQDRKAWFDKTQP
jgi:hypothetical protein